MASHASTRLSKRSLRQTSTANPSSPITMTEVRQRLDIKPTSSGLESRVMQHIRSHGGNEARSDPVFKSANPMHPIFV
jgi:hypothetical protein